MTTSAPGTTARPAPVSLAVKLLYAIAALGIISAVLTVADTSGVRERAHLASPQLSSSGLDTVVTITVVSSLIGGLIGAALWILFAIFTGRGRNWARIVVTVLSALAVVAGLIALGGGVTLPEVATLLAALCAIGVIVLLYRRESSAFFAARGAARRQVADPGYPGQSGYPPVR